VLTSYVESPRATTVGCVVARLRMCVASVIRIPEDDILSVSLRLLMSVSQKITVDNIEKEGIYRAEMGIGARGGAGLRCIASSGRRNAPCCNEASPFLVDFRIPWLLPLFCYCGQINQNTT